MSPAKVPTVPAASRPAFAAALHLALLEPDRIGYRDLAYAGGGRYNLYVGTPPTAGATKQEREAAREAFYDHPDKVATAKELAELVASAGVALGEADQLPGELTYYRAGAKSGGHRVLDRGRLIYVGRTYDDRRQVMGLPAPVPVDYASLPPMRVGEVTVGTADAAAIERARERQRAGIGEEAHRRHVSTDEVCAERGVSPAIMGDDAATIADVAAEHLGEPAPSSSPPARRADGLPKRKSGEDVGAYALRAARESGRVVYVYRKSFGQLRASDQPPTGCGWRAVLPNGTTYAAQYGRTSKKGQEAWAEVRKRHAAWREAAAKDAARAQAPEPTPATVGHATIGAHLEPAPPPTPSELPAEAEGWLARLIHPPKRTYARAYLEHLHNGAPEPADPGEDWARKARHKANRLCKT